MSSSIVSSLRTKLSMPTSAFGIPLWVFILICSTLFALLLLFFSFLFIICRQRLRKWQRAQYHPLKPSISESFRNLFSDPSPLDRRLLSPIASGTEMNTGEPAHQVPIPGLWPPHEYGQPITHCTPVADLRYSPGFSGSGFEDSSLGVVSGNVIGSGDSGLVYSGFLFNGTLVAVKILLSNSQAHEFQAQVSMIALARHKNLIKLLGYCTDGDQRMLAYEYFDNGSLHQWLHGCIDQVSPLTWGIRMNIIRGIAKGLAYLHEDIEPKIVHQNLKSTNILLDHQWNPKISHFGFDKLFGPLWNHVITRMMLTSGYVAPEYASTGVLTESSDVYSFGILMMEIISGRTTVDYSIPEVFLIDWFKSTISNQEYDLLLDPKLPDTPSLVELKRIVLVALVCANPEAGSRPKMGNVIRMLEPRELLLSGEQQIMRAASYQNYSPDL